MKLCFCPWYLFLKVMLVSIVEVSTLSSLSVTVALYKMILAWHYCPSIGQGSLVGRQLHPRLAGLILLFWTFLLWFGMILVIFCMNLYDSFILLLFTTCLREGSPPLSGKKIKNKNDLRGNEFWMIWVLWHLSDGLSRELLLVGPKVLQTNNLGIFGTKPPPHDYGRSRAKNERNLPPHSPWKVPEHSWGIRGSRHVQLHAHRWIKPSNYLYLTFFNFWICCFWRSC